MLLKFEEKKTIKATKQKYGRQAVNPCSCPREEQDNRQTESSALSRTPKKHAGSAIQVIKQLQGRRKKKGRQLQRNSEETQTFMDTVSMLL